MKQTLLLIFVGLMLYNCTSETKDVKTEVDISKPTDQITGKKFFDYDEIDYYFNNFDEDKIDELYDNQSKSEIDSFKMGIILGDIPKDISDLSFIEKLEKIGYQKKMVDKSKFSEIDKIFVEKTVTEMIKSPCIYVYRDILIFKKNSNVIGTAKICFGCLAHQINGTTANTNYFGQNGDYNKLSKLLKK